MCNNMRKNKVCVYKEKCHFAHNINELNGCSYGLDCIFISTTTDGNGNKVLKNSTTSRNICMYIHTGENESQYYDRIEMEKNKEKNKEKNGFKIPSHIQKMNYNCFNTTYKCFPEPIKINLVDAPIKKTEWTKIYNKKHTSSNDTHNITVASTEVHDVIQRIMNDKVVNVTLKITY